MSFSGSTCYKRGWHADGMRVVRGWYADGTRMVCRWYADGTRTVRGWYADAMRMARGWYADVFKYMGPKVLGTKYLVPGNSYQVLDARSLALSALHQVLGTKYFVPSMLH